MRTVEISTKDFQKIPGYTTKLKVSTWKGKIFALLDELDVEAQGWIKDRVTGSQILAFSMNIKIGNVEKIVDFRMEPVLIRRQVRKGRGRALVRVVDEEKASWKLFHDLLERKVAAAKIGIVDVHHEFMCYIAKRLPDDSIRTFADFMDIALQRPEGLDGLQLEYIPEAQFVEAEVVVREGEEERDERG